MRAIILLAGEGKRIRSITNEPKCFLKINNKTILENALDCIKDHFPETVLVTGYRSECIKRVGDTYKGMKITYVHNPFYKETNNMYSLYLARSYLKEGAVCFDGDIFFEKNLLDKVMVSKPDCWAADRNKDLEGSVLTSDNEGKITNVEIFRQRVYFDNKYKSAAIIKMSPSLGTKLSCWLEEDVALGNTNIYIDLVIGKRLGYHDICISDITGLKWFEIDTEEDYSAAKQLFGTA